MDADSETTRRVRKGAACSLQLPSPTPFCMGETVARIKLICMYVCILMCMCVCVCAGIG